MRRTAGTNNVGDLPNRAPGPCNLRDLSRRADHLKLWARVAPPSAMARFLKVSIRAARSRVSTLVQLGRTTAFCVYLIMNKESKDKRDDERGEDPERPE